MELICTELEAPLHQGRAGCATRCGAGVAELQSSISCSGTGVLRVQRLPGPPSTQMLEKLLGVTVGSLGTALAWSRRMSPWTAPEFVPSRPEVRGGLQGSWLRGSCRRSSSGWGDRLLAVFGKTAASFDRTGVGFGQVCFLV